MIRGSCVAGVDDSSISNDIGTWNLVDLNEDMEFYYPNPSYLLKAVFN